MMSLSNASLAAIREVTLSFSSNSGAIEIAS